ncbi:MAG: hypothetical protein IPN34_23855 [Planctomycetes bacterium]|nr:hypothetical protein [Planctomycetota bacterium]
MRRFPRVVLAPFLALALSSCDPMCVIQQDLVLAPEAGPTEIQERLAPFDFAWKAPYIQRAPEPEEVRPAVLYGAGWPVILEWFARRRVLEIYTGKITTDFSAEEVATQVRAHERVFERLAPLLAPEARAAGVILRTGEYWFDDEDLAEHLERLRASGTLGPKGARTPAGR